jgi:hypothetical protein
MIYLLPLIKNSMQFDQQVQYLSRREGEYNGKAYYRIKFLAGDSVLEVGCDVTSYDKCEYFASGDRFTAHFVLREFKGQPKLRIWKVEA